MSTNFDPAQPYEAVNDAPTFDPSQPHETIAVAERPQFDPAQSFEPVDEAAPTFDAGQPFDVVAPDDEQQRQEAQARVMGLAYSIAGNPMIPGGAALLPVLSGAGGKAGDLAVEVGAPILGAIAGAPGGLPGIVAGGAIGGGVGTTLRQIREEARGERAGLSPGQIVAGTAMGGIPLGKPAQVGGSIAKQALARGTQGAVLSLGGKAVETGIDEKRLPTLREASESVLGGGLVGGVLGAGEQSLTNGAVGKAVSWFRQRFTPQSILGPQIADAIKDASAGVKAEVYKTERRVVDLEEALKPLKGEAKEKVRAGVQDYLTGELPLHSLPENVRGPASAIRAHVDELTSRAINEGAVVGPTAETFLNNRGTYLRRSYKLFSDPDYRPEPKVFDNAVRDLMESDGIGRNEATDLANELLDRGKTDSLMTGGGRRKDGKDISSLMKRDELRPAIRELLGEVKDPIENYGQTIPRMARLVEYDAAQRKIADIGEALGLFSRQSDAAKFTTRLGGADNERLNRYSGLWTSPEVKAALENLGELPANGSIERTLATATSLSKASKTLLNPESYAPNLIGSAVMAAANGHIGIHRGGDGFLLMGENLGLLKNFGKTVDRERVRQIAEKMIRLRILDSSVAVNDLAGSVERGFNNQIRGGARYILKPLGDVWQGSDNLFKLVAFEGERRRYASAYPHMTEEQLDDKAASVVRDVLPNYAEVPAWVRKLSERGIVQNFVSFTFEAYRNVFNVARIGLNDIKAGQQTGNTALTAAGLKRLVPFTVAIAASSPVGLSLASRTKAGMSADDEEAARFLMPEWDSSGTLLWNGFVRGKDIVYSNQSYVLPHSIVMQAVAAGMRGDNPAEAYWRSMGEQFLGGNIVIGPLAEAIAGRTSTGRQIGTPEAGALQNAGERAAYALDEIFEPVAVRTVQKMEKAFTGEKGAYGEKYEMADRLWRLAGIRKTRIDIPERLQHKTAELASRLDAATQFYRREMNRSQSPDNLQSLYGRSETARRQVFKEMVQTFKYGQQLGMTEDSIINAFKKAGASSVVILGAMEGRYVPGEKGKAETAQDIFDRIRDWPEKERKSYIMQQEVGLARKLIEREKDARKALTPKDALVLGLGVSDGTRADYIRGQLERAPSADERVKLMQHYVRIRALTPEVQGQMQSYPAPQ